MLILNLLLFVCVLSNYIFVFLNVLKDDIENVKKDWEFGRLKVLKEEEERRVELEEDEMLYIYLRDDVYN